MTDAKGVATTYTYEDALGRTVCETRPGFGGALLVTSNEYNTANQLIATRTYSSNSDPSNSNSELQLVPLAFTLICYNSLGKRTLTISDMNLNHQIDWNDTDRIVSNDVRFVMLDGDWWRESSSWQTRQNDSPELTLMGRSRTRLTGLGNGLVSETRSFDPLGHTVTTTYDAEGRILAQRGATYPVDYTYDAYGNKVSMTTYRNESDVPDLNVVGRGLRPRRDVGDTTRWLYDEPSGCMTNKVYADGKGPRYASGPRDLTRATGRDCGIIPVCRFDR